MRTVEWENKWENRPIFKDVVSCVRHDCPWYGINTWNPINCQIDPRKCSNHLQKLWNTHGNRRLSHFLFVFNRVYKCEMMKRMEKKNIFLFASYFGRLLQFLIMATVRLVFSWITTTKLSCIESFAYPLSSLSTCNLTPRRICYVLKWKCVCFCSCSCSPFFFRRCRLPFAFWFNFQPIDGSLCRFILL